jgi:hypothetical protein
VVGWGLVEAIVVGWGLVEALVRPVVVEMVHILVEDGAGVPLVVDQQPVGALLAGGTNEPLGIAVRPAVPSKRHTEGTADG